MSDTIMDRLRANALFKEDASEIYELIERLTAEVERLKDQIVEDVIFKALRERIEELESRDIGEDIQEFNHAHGVYEITTEQIDTAWRDRYKEGYGAIHLKARILGIDHCEECGGEGVVDNNRMKPVSCVPCHGHGWVVK